jgi:hypothetical protein
MHKNFQNLILFVIILQSLKLAVDSYFPSEITAETGRTDRQTMQILANFDLIISLMFILEFFIKAIARGFVMKFGSYLRDPWS